MKIDNVIILIGCNDLVTALLFLLYRFMITFFVVLIRLATLFVVTIRLQCPDEVVVVLNLPATSPYLEEEVSKSAAILPVRHCAQVAECPVNDCHVDFRANVA